MSGQKTGKTVELQERIHSDLFNQEKLILNGVDLMVKLHRHKPKFCLLSVDAAPAYKIIIVDAIKIMLFLVKYQSE